MAVSKETIISKVKTALRIRSKDEGLNEEVADLVDAAILDLASSGINEDLENQLFAQAVIVYCKAQFGFDNPDSERLNDSYISMKHKMMNMEAYREK